jgi:hypothetical protein
LAQDKKKPNASERDYVMKDRKDIKMGLARPLLLAATAFTFIFNIPSFAARPGGGGGGIPSADVGRILYWSGGGVYAVNTDGSQKTLVIATTDFFIDVSAGFHNGVRWFLAFAEIPGELYPEIPPRPRLELFAFSTLGWVQLTYDPTVQPNHSMYPYLIPRWHTANGVIDGRVSFSGRRWVLDDSGNSVVVDAGIYYLDLDPDSLLTSFKAAEPEFLSSVNIPWEDFGSGPTAAAGGYDFSPNGDYLVYAAGETSTLYVAAVADGPTVSLNQTGSNPRWSPVRTDETTKILFGSNAGLRTVNPDGSGVATVVPLPGKPGEYSLGPANWSPSGTHFIYRLRKNTTRPSSSAENVYRAAADGSGQVMLARDALPVGWRNP